MSTHVETEIASQPECWRKAAEVAEANTALLPAPGQRVAIVGCGTSWFIAQAAATRREVLGLGVTDAFAGSEYPIDRSYDLVITISRSGTTTEILRLLDELRGRQRTLAIIGDPTSPGANAADATILLPFADEQSVVQTRFATSALALLRAHYGDDVDKLAKQAEDVVGWQVPDDVIARSQFTFLGRGWSIGLANEAALKMREASISWSESYPAMDFRHGPISISDPSSVVTFLGEVPEGLIGQTEATGALVQQFDEDAQLTLIRCQKVAIGKAFAKGLNPDQPRNLTRSIILDEQ